MKVNDLPFQMNTDEKGTCNYLCGLVFSYQFRIHRLQGCNKLVWTVFVVLHTSHWGKVNIQCIGQVEGREAVSVQMMKGRGGSAITSY